MHIHVCLVSAQLLANYIPVLMDKPDLVVLLSSTRMRVEAGRFARMLQQRGVRHSVRQDVPDAGFANIRQFATTLLAELQEKYSQANLTANITGGTKLMSLGLQEVFAATGHRIIYTDTAKGYLELLQTATLEPLQAVLNVRDYLQAYGANTLHCLSEDPLWHTNALQRRAAAQHLAELSGQSHLKSLIKVLNALAMKALSLRGDSLIAPQQAFDRPLAANWREALQPLLDAGLLALLPNEQDVVFMDAERTRFLCGHWLEEYAWQVAEQLDLDDAACGVEIRWEKSDTYNELDVVVTHNNRLLALECKTGVFASKHSTLKGTDPNHVLYKMDSIGDSIKGLYGNVALLTVWDLPEEAQERARTQKLRLINPQELRDFLQHWSAGG